MRIGWVDIPDERFHAVCDMGATTIGLLTFLCAIADEYKKLWNEHEDLFWGHSWGELWIEELILKGNTLELFVGS